MKIYTISMVTKLKMLYSIFFVADMQHANLYKHILFITMTQNLGVRVLNAMTFFDHITRI